MLASLSTFRLLVIVGKVQAAVKLAPAGDKTAALRFVQVLGSLQLCLGSSAQLLQSAQVLTCLLSVCPPSLCHPLSSYFSLPCPLSLALFSTISLSPPPVMAPQSDALP